MMMSPALIKAEVGRQKSDADSSRPDDVVPQNDTTTSFSVLPQDCLDKMLSFLTLQECLTIGSTSLTFMGEIRSDLKRRRNKMTQSFAYTCTWLPPDSQEIKPYKHKLVHANGESTEGTILPTVRDRVESLCRALPRCHPSSAMARDLLDEINRDDIGQVNSQTFQDALDMNRNLVRSHRLHANLLSQAIYTDPDTPNPNRLTVTLEQYMSDVLCAFYLMGHSVAGIVEGGPTEAEWMDVILSEMPWMDRHSDLSVDSNRSEDSDRFEMASVNTCYRAWIFLHSTLLRLAPLTREQQVRLGLGPSLPFGSTFDTGLLEPYRPFRGHEFARRFLGVKDHLDHYWVAVRITLNDFGRLGPTFRGRDLIQSQTFFPSCCWLAMFQFLYTEPEEYTCPRTPFMRLWIGGELPVITWLLFMQEEANKVRPMTVSPPVVTLDYSNRE